MPNPCAITLWATQAASDSQQTLELDFHGFHREATPSSSYTSILVIVDHLSKQSLFILTYDTVTSPQLAQLFVLHFFSKHGIPSHVTSDHGSEFVSHFFRSLRMALDMKLHFTSGYHPEGDGQPNGRTRLSSNTFESTAIINKTIGLNSSH